MEILQIDIILLKVLEDVDLEFVCNVLVTCKHLNEKITKYYKNGEISLNYMPLFKKCNNITTYLKHYKSYISGKNFPDDPLWLFERESDCKYVEIHDKYVKIENSRFEKPEFFNYFTSYQFIPFKGALYHWKRLNEQQKYLAWSAITGTHPEIKLDKTLISEDLAVLLSELYWYYEKSFSRFYLEIYNIDNCDLINAKCIAVNEIRSELEYYRGNHFVTGYHNAFNKTEYIDNYINTSKIFPGIPSGNTLNFLIVREDDKKLNHIRRFKNLNLDQDSLLKEIMILNNIENEINEFNITKTDNLKTSNINYLTHMAINYPKSKNVDNLLPKKQSQDIANACVQQ